MKIKEMNKGTCTAKKKLYWEIWDSKLEKSHCRTGISRRHRSYEQGGRQNVDENVIKFKNMKCKNWGDRRRTEVMNKEEGKT